MPEKKPEYIDHQALKTRREVIERGRQSFGIRPLDDVIREAITHAWKATAHDAVLAAKMLGIARTTFYRYLKRFDLDRWA